MGVISQSRIMYLVSSSLVFLNIPIVHDIVTSALYRKTPNDLEVFIWFPKGTALLFWGNLQYGRTDLTNTMEKVSQISANQTSQNYDPKWQRAQQGANVGTYFSHLHQDLPIFCISYALTRPKYIGLSNFGRSSNSSWAGQQVPNHREFKKTKTKNT